MHEDSDPSKGKLFFNGFQWVMKVHSQKTMDANFMSITQKARRIKLLNVPLYLGLAEEDLTKIITQFFLENYLNDSSNKRVVLGVRILQNKRDIIFEVSSVEEANRILKVKFISVLGLDCKVQQIGELSQVEDHTLKTRIEQT